MSRVAKKPIALPKGVELNIQESSVSAKGPKGTLSLAKPAGVQIAIEDGNAVLSANDDALIPLTGTVRAILANMVKGVSEGFERKLELVGVGYRAAMQGVGEVAAKIRGFRPPEPYKGKGVKYSDEVIIRKEAKKA